MLLAAFEITESDLCSWTFPLLIYRLFSRSTLPKVPHSEQTCQFSLIQRQSHSNYPLREFILKLDGELFQPFFQWQASFCIVSQQLTFWLHACFLLQIEKERVDSFKMGRAIPSCQLTAVWTKQNKPSLVIHKLSLEGAKEPFTFLNVVLADSGSMSQAGITTWPLLEQCVYTSCRFYFFAKKIHL